MFFVERELYNDNGEDDDEGDDDDDEDDDGEDRKNRSKMKSKADKRGNEIKFNDFFVADKSQNSNKGNKRTVNSTSKLITKKKMTKSYNEEEEDDEEDDDEDYGDGFGDDGEDDEGDDGVDDYEDSDADADDNTASTNIGAGTSAIQSKQGPLSKHQKQSLRMAERIKELEQEIVAPKPWALMGEVKAQQRPENSLLEISAQMERYLLLVRI